jgi:hypothetical protein
MENLDKAGDSRSKDIAIVSSGNFESPNSLSLSMNRIPIDQNINMIGFLGKVAEGEASRLEEFGRK